MFNHAYTETPATACKNQFTQCVPVSGKFPHLAKEMIQCLIQVTLYFQFQTDSKSRFAISNLKFLTINFYDKWIRIKSFQKLQQHFRSYLHQFLLSFRQPAKPAC